MSKGAWFIATEEDIRSTRWAGLGKTPTPMIADRLRMLAKACYKCLEQGMEVGNFDIKVRFVSSRTTWTDQDRLERLCSCIH
jgi:hypothetical protein